MINLGIYRGIVTIVMKLMASPEELSQISMVVNTRDQNSDGRSSTPSLHVRDFRSEKTLGIGEPPPNAWIRGQWLEIWRSNVKSCMLILV
jgi:hypothetical protein